MLSGKSGNAPKTDVSIVTSPLASILCHFTSIISSPDNMGDLRFLRISRWLAFTVIGTGPNIAGTDPSTGEMIRLFHPRRDLWSEHFAWTAAALAGQTAIGCATIYVLAINDPDFLAVRNALIQEQVFSLE
jgi:hypothetical protein